MVTEVELRREIVKLEKRLYFLLDEQIRIAPLKIPTEGDENFKEWQAVEKEIDEIETHLDVLETKLINGEFTEIDFLASLDHKIRKALYTLNDNLSPLYEERVKLTPDNPPAETDKVFAEWSKVNSEITELEYCIDSLESALDEISDERKARQIAQKKEFFYEEDKSPAETAQEEWEAEREAEKAKKQWEAQRAELEKAVEKADEEKSRLAQLIREIDEKNDKDKGRRLLYVFLGFAAAFLLISYYLDWFKDVTVEEFFGAIFVCLFCAGFTLYINLVIFSYVCGKAHEGNEHLKHLEKRFEEASKELERKIEEKKRFEEKPPYSN